MQHPDFSGITLLLKPFSQFRANTPVQTRELSALGCFLLTLPAVQHFCLGFLCFPVKPVASFQKRPVEVIFSSLWKVFMKFSLQTEGSLSFHTSTTVPLSMVLFIYITPSSFHFSNFHQYFFFSHHQHTSLPPYFKLKQCNFVPCLYIGLHSISFPNFVCMCFLCSCSWNHALLPSPPCYRGALVTNESTYYHCFLNPLRTDIGLKWEQHPQELKDIFPCIIYG